MSAGRSHCLWFLFIHPHPHPRVLCNVHQWRGRAERCLPALSASRTVGKWHLRRVGRMPAAPWPFATHCSGTPSRSRQGPLKARNWLLRLGAARTVHTSQPKSASLPSPIFKPAGSSCYSHPGSSWGWGREEGSSESHGRSHKPGRSSGGGGASLAPEHRRPAMKLNSRVTEDPPSPLKGALLAAGLLAA